jgi:beta-glucosidase
VEYFANRTLEGEPVHVEVCSTGRLSWIDDDTVPSAGFSARLTATLIVDEDGPHTFGLTTAGTGRLWLDGELLCDNTDDPVPGSSFFGMGTEEVRSTVELLAGTEHELRCEYVSYRDLAIGGVQVGLLRPVPEDGIARAADAASRADAAVVVVGLNADWETEGHDRSSTELPGGQGELIRAVVAANPRTVVVVNAGAVVDLDDVVNAPGVLWIWYPGQEAADGVTDLLVGDVAPSGRLPTSFARRCEDHPAFATYPGADGVVRYDEGLSLGYRGLDATGVEPVFCFGHGLTYGSLDWGEVTLSTTSAAIDDLADEPVTVRLPLHNPGDRPLREVVQVYVSDVESSLECPPLELRGFVAVDVPPGGSAEALVELGPRAFAHWDPTAGDWVVEPGAFRVSASRSSRMHHAWLSLDLH